MLEGEGEGGTGREWGGGLKMGGLNVIKGDAI